jgi:hypothetical protein
MDELRSAMLLNNPNRLSLCRLLVKGEKSSRVSMDNDNEIGRG